MVNNILKKRGCELSSIRWQERNSLVILNPVAASYIGMNDFRFPI
jgi:hypothetical protein